MVKYNLNWYNFELKTKHANYMIIFYSSVDLNIA